MRLTIGDKGSSLEFIKNCRLVKERLLLVLHLVFLGNISFNHSLISVLCSCCLILLIQIFVTSELLNASKHSLLSELTKINQTYL